MAGRWSLVLVEADAVVDHVESDPALGTRDADREVRGTAMTMKLLCVRAVSRRRSAISCDIVPFAT